MKAANISRYFYNRIFVINVFLFIILSLTICNKFAYSQSSDIIFDRIFLQQGLSQSIVKCICQDKNGFMYFGTEDGLNIYDGYEFKILRHNKDNINSLSYNDINTLLVDHNGIIWVGTFNAGLNKYNPSNFNFTRYRHNPNNSKSLSHNNINVIFEDRSGTIWIGTDNGLNKIIIDTINNTTYFYNFLNDPKDITTLSDNTILSINQDKKGDLWVGTNSGLNKINYQNLITNKIEFIRFLFDPKNRSSLSNNTIRSIFEDSKDILWIGTDDGLNKIRERNGNVSFISFKNNPDIKTSISHNEIYAINEDENGTLWIGTNGGGINLHERNENTFTRYLNNPLDSRSIGYNEIRSIFRDKAGIMWIGTYGNGVNKVARGRKQFFHYNHIPNNLNSISHPIVWSIYKDEEGILWVGTHGGGLDRIDRKSNTIKHYKNIPDNKLSLSSDVVRVIMPDKNGFLWIGTNGGGINKFDKSTGKFKRYLHDPSNPNSIQHNDIRKIYQDRSGIIWIGTYGKGLDRFDESTETFEHFINDPNNPNSLSNDFVRSIYEDKKGNFWIGTEGGGLNKFDRKNKSFKIYRNDPENKNSISNDYIFTIHEDKNGFLWLGTWGGGLNKFDPVNETFKIYTNEDGLPSNAIYGILEDESGNFWISTNNGISKFNPFKEIFKNYNIKDGLQSNEFNGGSYFIAKDGEMFFGGIKGFNSFYPSNIKDNSFIPPIVISSFLKFNKEIKFERPIYEMKEIELSYLDYVFSFEFSALDYTAPEKNQYAYKMEGLDKDWIYTNYDKRFATYTTLTPGEYTFKVIGSNSDGIWNNNGASIKIIIHPPFWQSWWFVTLVLLILIITGYFLYRRRLKNIRLKIELDTAHNAQMSIMPLEDPMIEGLELSSICIPANEVGGDFYDYFSIDSNRSKLGIFIGDVSGKAMNAAMTAVMTSGMLITETCKSDSIADILSKINLPLYHKTKKNMFTAVCLATINTKTKEFTFSNAGLVNPVLKTNGTVEFLKSNGPRFPLGVKENVIYEVKNLQLKKDDVIVFMTDGILESQNKLKDLYGEQRLIDLLKITDSSKLTAKEIKELIINDTRKFSGKHPQYDDITIVVLKIN